MQTVTAVLSGVDWSDHLPDVIITEVLGRVPVSSRLTSCVLVSHRWAQAAAAATNSLAVGLKAADSIHGQTFDTHSLAAWLESHGHAVEQMQLGAAAALLSLPCPNLQELSLHGCSSIDCCVDWADSQPSLWSSITSATKLTSLGFEDVTFRFGPKQLELVTALTKLQRLTWGDCWFDTTAPAFGTLQQHSYQFQPQHNHQHQPQHQHPQHEPQHTFLQEDLNIYTVDDEDFIGDDGLVPVKLPACFSRLTALTFLKAIPSLKALQTLGALKSLKHLDLDLYRWIDPEEKPTVSLDWLSSLQKLTYLSMTTGNPDCTLSPSAAQNFSTELQQLHLVGCWGITFQPVLVAAFPCLRVLSIRGAYESGTAWEDEHDAPDTVALLGAIGGLHRLTDLNLTQVNLSGCPVEAFSGLTASSCLQYLTLIDCTDSSKPCHIRRARLDASGWDAVRQEGGEVWQRVFPADRKLPELRAICLISGWDPWAMARRGRGV